MKILSFVVPAYNSEHFLDKGIPSMLAPEVLDRLEVIIVNDGSTDGTAAAAEKYCAQYPGVVRLIDQENKGHGGALNTGLAAAQGKYVKVIDSDDWVVTENLPEFLEMLERCGSDVVLTHHHTIDISNGQVKEWKSDPAEFGRSYGLDEIMGQWRKFCRSMTFHGITYRREFYQNVGNQLPEHVFHEDYEFATFPCCRAESVTPFDLFIYEYRIGDVNQSIAAGNQLKRIGHTETVLRDMTEKYKALPQNAGKDYAAMKIQELILSYLTTVLLVEPDKKRGRMLAARLMEEYSRSAPEAAALAQKKYKAFLLMNRLHIKKGTWEKILESKLYQTLRNKRG